MADQIIAGQNSPTSHDATQGPDASDILENKLTQLQSLLHCCYGEEQELFEAIGAEHRGNLMWIAADLAAAAAELAQSVLKRPGALNIPQL
ncbi:hypothetical protein J2W32_005040 [Variovorax boronicumulans]|uniref:Uncharacterized protein n=1 Tax=Variovorax boronicumulans TaxID=436515 RepID=A0AAW8D9A2_9BURK|nr:hypothetical protein [Variovorax boronicumulans]MDP9895940.1 hypothetical protein [Variovorax boronicumulans]MDQ0045028.1 hypothetical protein [Variovorax boronicumulans]MDQ0055980.1 hypothetical protein [Variovorax boronicumulans]